MTKSNKVVYVQQTTKDRLYSKGKCQETADDVLNRVMDELDIVQKEIEILMDELEAVKEISK